MTLHRREIDLGYTIIAEPDVELGWIRFTVHRLGNSQVWLRGEVSDNGFSNWRFDETANLNLNFRDRQGCKDVGKLLTICWDWAFELSKKRQITSRRNLL